MQNWYYLCASVQGKGHFEDKIPCQDYSYSFQHNDYTICVVCDGAGSCENSHIGSYHVTHLANTHFMQLIEEQGWNNPSLNIEETDWTINAKQTLKKIKNDLEGKITIQGYSFKSLACTIIVVIQLKDILLVTHIGDGRAGYCNMNDEWFSMINPFKGNYTNETVFITSDIWDDEILLSKYIECRIIRNEIKAFCLLSDGCENASFECYQFDIEKNIPIDTNKPYKDFFDANINVNIPKLIMDGKDEKELNEIWASFLKEGNNTLKNEMDDKTMILALKYCPSKV